MEARRVLDEQLARYRPLTYGDLVAKINRVETLEIPREGGRPWQLEFQFHWDAEPGGDVRVIGSIDDGEVRAFVPISSSFIKNPAGDFVDE